MIRRLMISGFLFIFLTGIPLFSQAEQVRNNANDISTFEKRFKAVDESMKFLKNKNIDNNDLITLYTDTEALLRDIKYASEIKDYDLTVKFLSHKLSILEDKSLERVSLVKRMDLMYMLMVIMGMTIIIGMSIFSIYMYSRRK